MDKRKLNIILLIVVVSILTFVYYFYQNQWFDFLNWNWETNKVEESNNNSNEKSKTMSEIRKEHNNKAKSKLWKIKEKYGDDIVKEKLKWNWKNFYNFKITDKIKEKYDKNFYKIIKEYLEKSIYNWNKNDFFKFDYDWNELKVYFDWKWKIKKVVKIIEVDNENYEEDLKDSNIKKRIKAYNLIKKNFEKVYTENEQEQEKILNSIWQNEILRRQLERLYQNKERFANSYKRLQEDFKRKKEQLKTETKEIKLNNDVKDFELFLQWLSK